MLTRRRIGGSVAAAGLVAGTPAAATLLIGGPYRVFIIPAFVIALGLGLIAARLLWDVTSIRKSIGMLLTALISTGATTLVAFFGLYAFTISQGLCGGGGGGIPFVAIVVYAIIGIWAFQRPQRLLWAWPIAVVVGFVLLGAFLDVVPSAHGFCET